MQAVELTCIEIVLGGHGVQLSPSTKSPRKAGLCYSDDDGAATSIILRGGAPLCPILSLLLAKRVTKNEKLLKIRVGVY